MIIKVNLTFEQLWILKGKDTAQSTSSTCNGYDSYIEEPYDPLVKSNWSSEAVKYLWDSFIKNRDETRANELKTNRRDLQAVVDIDVR